MKELKIIEAAKDGDIDRIESLVAEGEDIEQADDYGWTAVNWAAAKGDARVVQKLRDLGANVANTGRDKRTPYQIALAAAHVECAEILQNAEKKAGFENESKTQPYCKAYPVEGLRKFSNWSEKQPNMENDAVVFLHQDFTVTSSIWHGENVVFDQHSPAWEKFCKEELRFSVPTELELAAAFAARKATDSHRSQS
ncbi:MAG: ankyrin repeat domain-containing protein [Methyloglobulus sp.]|nr:ankyrin repeat domain-containing protein [Methyloglobulus sp.]